MYHLVRDETYSVLTILNERLRPGHHVGQGEGPTREKQNKLKLAVLNASDQYNYNLLIRGALQAYDLTLPLLGFKCT